MTKNKTKVEIFGAADTREKYSEALSNIRAQMELDYANKQKRCYNLKIESANTTATHAPVGDSGSMGMIYVQTTVLYSYTT